MNNIRQKVAENDVDDLSGLIGDLKLKFSSFSKVHDGFADMVVDESTDECDEYFYKLQTDYISVLKEYNDSKPAVFKKPVTNDAEHSLIDERSVDSGSDFSREELLSLLNLPKVELQTFAGNPIHYHSFIKSFDANVDKLCQDPDLKLTRLLQYVSGAALEAIRGCQLLGGHKGYERARSILKSRYGNSHLVTEKILQDLKHGRPVRSASDIQQLADDIQNASLILDELEKTNEVNSQAVIIDIVGRLPGYAQIKWRKLALVHKRDRDEYPDFSDLVQFVIELADDCNDPVYGSFLPRRDKQKTPTRPSSSAHVTASLPVNAVRANPTNHAKSEPPCVLCGQLHRLWHCSAFRSMTPPDRFKLVNSKKLCHNCLRGSHTTDKCGKRSVCLVQGCNMKHTMWIHCDENSGLRPSNDSASPVHVDDAQSAQSCLCSVRGTFMPIVEVNVMCESGSQKCFALLDTGSSQSFCSNGLAQNLGLKGRTSELNLSTLSSTVKVKSDVVEFSVSSDLGECLEMKNVFVVDSIPVTNSVIDIIKYPHLCGIPLAAIYDSGNVTVDILIGQDNADALVPIEVRRGKPGQPFAIKTMFGWSLNGQAPVSKISRKVVSHFISSMPPEDEVNKLWKLENEGLDSVSWSREDTAVIELWDRETTMVDSHYVVPIPWRDREEPLPNNFVQAKSRLDSLRKRLDNNGMQCLYDAEIKKLLVKGYAEPVPSDIGHSDRVFYIPHHGVSTVKKPLRVVFDCACKFKGKSLNDRCLQGPDLINKLLPVLIRFRQHGIAIQADIEAMYNQVWIPPHDRDALRFLWYVNDNIEYYRMTSHLFGGVWCACSSTYALRRTVKDTLSVSPLVKYTVNNSFYVDDCLSSVTDIESARTVITELPDVLANGGFTLTKFAVNNAQLLSEIPSECRAKEVVDFGPECETKALGVKWRISTDEFFFVIQRSMNDSLTRRQMLSIASSIYDPLGLIGPLVLEGKLLFQEATIRKLSWDDPVPTDLIDRWQSWVSSLTRICDFSFPRCIKPHAFDDAAVELHHFSDASSKAYGCCSYLRCVNKYGDIHVQLIVSKCRVAPVKVCTIPRLELQAAVMSVKMDAFLRDELQLHIVNSTFWTDSMIVLKYIANESRRFHVFVANRVSVIHDHSIVDQWKHVDTKSNPADLVSRPQRPCNFNIKLWSEGPMFLKHHKCYWECQSAGTNELKCEDPEVRKSLSVITCAVDTETPAVTEMNNGVLDRIMSHYSSWYKMKRALVYFVRFLEYLRGRLNKTPLTVLEIKAAGLMLIRRSQHVMFPDELRRLTSGSAVKVSSCLRTLSPYIDESGAIRIGGRIKEADVINKNPYVIHANHVISRAIIHDAHGIGHVGVEWTLSLMRKDFWMIKARPLIKRLIKSCVTCRRLYANSCQQLMANLPKDRLEINKPPFSVIGVDLFGPFHVKYGRAEIKRYGCLFTCFGCRAIHVEKLDCLDADSFLNGLRRFIARRGQPEKVYSDLGTNLVGGHSELKGSVAALRKNAITTFATKRDIEWHFRPPLASHWGGVWERMIGMVRRIMPAVLSKTRLTDEILETVFCEIEAIVNGRPLTKLNDTPDDLSPLTPNHLLLLRSGTDMPPGKFSQSDMLTRRWRHVQHLADQFWRKWLRAYLPELQRRVKWTKASLNLNKGDLVILMDEMTPRNVWPLALVADIIKGRDGLVRSVKVKTRKTELTRPITKIVLLEAVDDTPA